jgi:hypothetical protein
LTGSELVPVVQNGVTVQTTTGSISGAGALNYPFLTVGSTSGLTQARYLATGTGLSLADNGAGSTLQINLTGIYPSLNTVGNGFVVKNGSSTLINRTLTVGSGMTISDGDGISANPLIGLSQLLQNISSTTSVGLLTVNGTTITASTIVGTTNQISIANGNGVAGSPTVSIYPNPVLPGTGSVVLPQGTTAQRSGTNGALRYNTDTASLEAYTNSAWGAIVSGSGVTTFSAGTTGLTPNTPTAGGITLAGTLIPANGGTGATTLTGYVYGNGTSTMTASTTIPTTALSGTVTNAQLSNSSVTYNGVAVALGASGTITATATNALTIGTGLSGTSYNGSTAVTIAIDSTVATLTGIQTLTNKSISGSTNTFSNIPNVALTNSSLTVGTTSIALGATSLTLGGLTSVTVTQDPVSGLQLATKQYVDAVAQGLNTKQAVLVATTVNITLSGEQTIDGVTTSASRVLVKNQTTQANNGIYLSGTGAWTRTLDANTWNQLISAYVFVETGSTQADTGWVCTVDPGGTLGVTAVTWAQFSGAGTYTAGTGLTLTGTVFSLTAPVTVPLGGTGLTSLTAGYIPYGAGTSALASVSTFNYNTTTSTLNAPTMAVSSVTSTTPVLSFNGSNTSFASGATVASSYLQFLMQNKSGTAGASTNYVLSNDLGTDSTYYGEFGMNSSVFSASTPADFFSINNGVYFSAHDGDVTVGSGNGFKTYLAWGTVGQSAHVINASGALGFSTNLGTTPALSGTTGFGTSGYLLQTAGSTGAPSWVAQSTITAGNATNAVNTGITLTTTGATNYITFVTATSGNLPQLVNSSITANAVNGTITGGIAGGAF